MSEFAFQSSNVETALLERGTEALRRLGSMSLGGMSVDGGIQRATQAAFAYYVDPKSRFEPGDQLVFMTNVLGVLGHKAPEVSDEQRARLKEVSREHPEHRILLVPLLGFSDRQTFAERARILPGHRFHPEKPALRLPDEGTVYSRLAVDLHGDAEQDGATHAVRYKTPDGRVVGRKEYFAALAVKGSAIVGTGNTPWTFLVADVQVNAPRIAEEAGSLYQRIDPIASPESLILTQVLHQGAGLPNPSWNIDFANEAVYEQEDGTDAAYPSYIATIRWRTDRQQIGAYARRFESVRDYMGIREAVSGI